jgi:hypothetical protein
VSSWSVIFSSISTSIFFRVRAHTKFVHFKAETSSCWSKTSSYLRYRPCVFAGLALLGDVTSIAAYAASLNAAYLSESFSATELPSALFFLRSFRESISNNQNYDGK